MVPLARGRSQTVYSTRALISAAQRENMPVKRLATLSATCLLLALCWLSPARAVIVGGLYEARVPVTDQSVASRNAALQQAFGMVLVKVTGDRAAAGALATAFDNPTQYVQQYRYEKVDADPVNNLPAGLML